MTKLYDMNQHQQACNQRFTITYTYALYYIPTSEIEAHGFSEVVKLIGSEGLTVERMFDIFIDNAAKKHCIMYLDDNGDWSYMIKIELNKEGK
ncbi:hypothetical protein VPHG_00088 [Vibrio phage 11895-B1]|uniref:hypothetical protein n=1 Tax=Vibrio phage 11895-B1 TaxID=754075 RepID=UPI0002C04BF4|nr:hypothetical protein VPHG_00088 [Vibrio phage 11895-B1]AGH32155.1 hypothetical protein VPHG_00088 [Vibrio phage 11895-B1]